MIKYAFLAMCVTMATPATGALLENPTGTRINEYGMEMPTFDANDGVCHIGGVVINEENCLEFNKFGEAGLPTFLQPREGKYETALQEYLETGRYNYIKKKLPDLPVSPVPLPAPFWFLIAACGGLFMIKKRKG